MSQKRPQAPFALALLAATCLTPAAPAAAAPGDRIGPEFQVNTTTADQQTNPAVAMDADGDFVVAWTRCHLVTTAMGVECTGYDVFAQRYNAAGERQGTEFQVNSFTTGSQTFPAVAMDADGDFVVAWLSVGQQGVESHDIFAQRYNAAGEPQGGEVLVNLAGVRWNLDPSVAMDADGDFVVAWERMYYGGYFDAVFRRYDAAGVPQGGEVRINSNGGGGDRHPTVATDANGDFVVAWRGYGPAPDFAAGVFAERYNSAGELQGGAFQVNSGGSGWDWRPSLGVDADGDFVIAWQSLDQDGAGLGIFAQRFNAAGEPQGTEFQVNTFTAGDQKFPAVAVDADGDFVVAWTGSGPDDASGVFARRFDAAGLPQGGQFTVNTTVTGDQGRWDGNGIAMDADGDVVAAWTDFAGLDGDGWGIFAQRFDGVERTEGDFDGDGRSDLLWRNVANGAIVLWLMDGEMRLDAGTIGVVPTAWEIVGTGDFNGDGKADILWRNTTTGTAAVWQMDGLEKAATRSIGAPPLTWEVAQLRDTDGDGLTDIVWRNTGNGTTVVWRMSGFTRVAAEPIGNVNADWQLR